MFFFFNYKAKFSTNSILKLTSSILKKYNRQRQFCAKKKPKKNEKQIGGKNKKKNKTKKQKTKK